MPSRPDPRLIAEAHHSIAARFELLRWLRRANDPRAALLATTMTWGIEHRGGLQRGCQTSWAGVLEALLDQPSEVRHELARWLEPWVSHIPPRVRRMDRHHDLDALDRGRLDPAVASLTRSHTTRPWWRKLDETGELFDQPGLRSLHWLRVAASRPRWARTSPELAGQQSRHHLERLLAWAPARDLHHLDLSMNWLDDDAVVALARADTLASLRGLQLEGNRTGERGAAALATRRLRRLGLAHNRLRDDGVAAFVEALARPGLRHLDLSHNGLTDEAARRLAACQALSQLERLDLAGNILTDDGVHALVDSPNLARLSWLRLSDNYISRDGFDALVAAHSRLTSLEQLDLCGNLVGYGGSSRGAAVTPPRLRVLKLRDNDIDARTVAELAACTELAELRHLDLGGNPIGADGAAHIARSTVLGRVVRLHLRGELAVGFDVTMGDEGARALAASETLDAVRTLDLRHQRLTTVGVDAILAHRRGLPALRRLRVRDRHPLGPKSTVLVPQDHPHYIVQVTD